MEAGTYMATQKRNVLENPDRIFTPTEVDDIDSYPPATAPV